MASLTEMPPISIDKKILLDWGKLWHGLLASNGSTKEGSRFDKKQAMDFGKQVVDPAIAQAIAKMLGGIKIEKPISSTSLLPPGPDCVELGDTRIIGGVRPQNFDVAYRPDGVRIAYDSKTLNDMGSVRKNWQNMINDLATEATTVHTRFPYAIVGFVVIIPKLALSTVQAYDIIRTLERLGTRKNVTDQNHLAEVISLIVWDTEKGEIDPLVPDASSNLRIENFSKTLYPLYLDRYKGLPPHDKT